MTYNIFFRILYFPGMLLCIYILYFHVLIDVKMLFKNVILMFLLIDCIFMKLQGQGQHVRVNVSVSVPLLSYYIFVFLVIIISHCLGHLPLTL